MSGERNAQVESSGKEEAGEHNTQIGTSGKEEAGDAAGDRQWMSLGEARCDGATVTLKVQYQGKAAKAVKGNGPGRFVLALKNWNTKPAIVKQIKSFAVFGVVPQAAWPPRALSTKAEYITEKLGRSAINPSLQCLASCGILNKNSSPDSLVRKWALHVGKRSPWRAGFASGVFNRWHLPTVSQEHVAVSARRWRIHAGAYGSVRQGAVPASIREFPRGWCGACHFMHWQENFHEPRPARRAVGFSI